MDEIAHGFDYLPFQQLYSLDPDSSKLYQRVFSKDALVQQVHRCFPNFPVEKIQPVGHHLAHAASAAFTSGWDECLVVVNDAMGEVQSLTVFQFRDGEFKKTARNTRQRFHRHPVFAGYAAPGFRFQLR